MLAAGVWPLPLRLSVRSADRRHAWRCGNGGCIFQFVMVITSQASFSLKIFIIFSSSHCVPTSCEALLKSKFPILSSFLSVISVCKSIILSSSCLSLASAVNGSVGRFSVRLMASAAEFFLPAKCFILNLNWLGWTLAWANLLGQEHRFWRYVRHM